ncbi:D-aminoacylase domain protein [Sphingobium chlorophenolicum L-1]|uniref:D-aminoacylase domain protein n=1 Tax=Sphingobium chlorophenolicum L-1 TaxID=690566 RepID=F6EWC2_SPHCR|nr:amidohydrolase family protein [Sphingobium chlorophenolicum]AEG49816.1 D-aminoacylase domain protein [Sphingobium chlorophenolicum L-1]
MLYDIVIRGGTVIDGTGEKRYVADIALAEGRIAKIGDIAKQGAREIDANGLIVAPGVVDLHAHYDAQLHWDPYCTASGWHGTTSVMIGNCGFGFAPVRPGDSDRYMLMMENTEQVPYDAMKRTMPWTWETFAEWLDHLRQLPKGLNIATYLPMNALLSYVIGADQSKKRPATEAERTEMRRILNEAMDAGACGFSFSFMGAEGNSHVDYDQSPMPTDVMDPQEAYILADVLRERGDGIIQVIVEFPGAPVRRRDVIEELARRSGRPVLHNITVAGVDREQHLEVLRWLDAANAKGLDIWSQGAAGRKPHEILPLDYNNWDSQPIFREISAVHSREGKIELIQSDDYRARFTQTYRPGLLASRSLEHWILVQAGDATRFEPFEGRYLPEIAEQLGISVAEVFLDLLSESRFECMFSNPVTGLDDGVSVAELFRHPRVLTGISDGGAHSKHGNSGFWSTDLLVLLTRDTGQMSLEEIHALLSARNARVAGFVDRGTLQEGSWADVMIYDWEKLDFEPKFAYEKVYDLPGGDWRKVKRPVGIRYVLVNGEIIMEDGAKTGATPGLVLTSEPEVSSLASREAAE